tara:strand:+ start:44 stop:760 length:717 start_codon:yes stop_codon:yes gene_type:complete
LTGSIACSNPAFSRNWDDKLFRERILQHLSKETIVLDIGAGAGIVEEMNFRGLVARMCGVDLDPRVQNNPMLDEGKVSDTGEIPYPDATFDVAFADNVMEHLANPEAVFREAHRVLRPGGVLLFKTPNKTHYMPLIARLTPHKFHQYINKLRGRAEVDTFQTLYRANSVLQVRRLARVTGFQTADCERVEGRPEYMRMFFLSYLLGALYERLVNLTDLFAPLRILLMVKLQKPHAKTP